MSVATIGLLGVVFLLVLIFLRVPIAVSLALSGLVGYAAIDGWHSALRMFGLVPYQLSSAYSLSVIPLFILMGAVASRGKMAAELFQACNAVFSGVRGALANATIGACAVRRDLRLPRSRPPRRYQVAIPEMRGTAMTRRLPPERRFRRHARRADPAIGAARDLRHRRRAIAAEALCRGVHSRLCAGGAYVIVVWVVAWIKPAWIPKVAGMSLRARLRASLGMWKLGILFIFAVFGIYLGWFSPTEAAAVAAFAAIIIAFATRAMDWHGLVDALLESVYTTASIFFIVVGAFIFSRFIVLTQFPNELVKWVQVVGLSPFWILMSVIALYVLLGTFLDEVSTILITVPVTLPLINGIGFDGIWFGVFVTVMCTIGLISPPTGMTVFVIQAQHPEIPVARIYLGTLPFLVADFVLVALLILMPSLALWLPSVLY